MRLKKLTCGAAVALAMAVMVPSAIAQAVPCEETQFTAKAGQAYLDAENAYLTEGQLETAKSLMTKLKGMTLNCYERSAVIRLSAGINVKSGDYKAAIRDLEEALPTFTGENRTETLYNIAQLYLQTDDNKNAAAKLEEWIASGAKPTGQQFMQMATLYQQLGDNNKAIKYLEAMLNKDANPSKQAIDFAVYLYNETGQKTKLASFLMNKVIPSFPAEKKYYEVMSSLYYEDENDHKAFEVVKAMYLAGFLKTESEVMRVVNFYNAFNSPFEAAKVMEKEMNAGRIEVTAEKLDTLANLYQVSREYDRAIPVIQKLAKLTNSGKSYERLGRSYFEMGKNEEAEKNLRLALDKGGMKEPGFGWVLIGQIKHKEGDRAGARTAFSNAAKLGDRGGRGWLDFMASEDETKRALAEFDLRVAVEELKNVKKACKLTEVLGGEPAEECKTVDARIVEAAAKLGEDAEGKKLVAEDTAAKEAAEEDDA
ncbi:tetratricopeptide repeat protein [Hirschia baltica]|uniref:Tetratricopeptide domain protein n=1 Tax=Hirschia baltica (strain ATCC 49814 / DSM 5838 / IFAM 1418) TaxID=582402 RepID=C6XI79_HIRBI|nr:tetratricopeptide repeat protein [Hirschia baltica]ACT58905.1 Tetratricopeptide domain protein [Hirschia baltica ATCC 49814]